MRRDSLNEIARRVLIEEGFFDSAASTIKRAGKAVAGAASGAASTSVGRAVSKTFTDARRSVFGETPEEKINKYVNDLTGIFDAVITDRIATSTPTATHRSKIAFSRSGEVAVVVIDGSAKVASQLVPQDKSKFPNFSSFAATCVALTKQTRTKLGKESLVYTDPVRWSENFWSVPRLAKLRSELPPDAQRRIGQVIARHVQQSVASIPFVWVAGSPRDSSAARDSAWSEFTSNMIGYDVGTSIAGFYSPEYNVVVMNVITDNVLRFMSINGYEQLSPSFDIDRNVLVHEVMHAKSGFMTKIVDMLLQSEPTNSFVSSARVSGAGESSSRGEQPEVSSGLEAGSDFVAMYYSAVSSGWAASIVKPGKKSIEDVTELFELAYRTMVEATTFTALEGAANFNALCEVLLRAMGVNEKPTEENPTILLPNLESLREKEALVKSSKVFADVNGSMPNFAAYRFTFTDRPDPTQKIRLINGIRSNYTILGNSINLSIADVLSSRERSADLSSPEHIYNALTHIQRLFDAMKRRGASFESYANGVLAIDVMKALTSGDYVNLNREDARRVALLLVAAAKNSSGELPDQFFTAIDKLAVRDTRQMRPRQMRSSPVEQDQEKAVG
jgi:hypothetical protein